MSEIEHASYEHRPNHDHSGDDPRVNRCSVASHRSAAGARGGAADTLRWIGSTLWTLGRRLDLLESRIREEWKPLTPEDLTQVSKALQFAGYDDVAIKDTLNLMMIAPEERQWSEEEYRRWLVYWTETLTKVQSELPTGAT